MTPTRRALTVLGLGVIGTAIVAAAPMASSTPLAPGNTMIGKPVTTPARMVAGRQFSVSFMVRHTDTRAPMTLGRMIAHPYVDARIIQHTESFKGGRARLSFLVPQTATGKLVTVKLAINAGDHSARKVASFRVQPAPTPSLSVDDVSTAEGSTGTTTLSVPVTLSASTARTVVVRYTTAEGTAIAPSDFATASGTLTFQPGETVQTIPVTIVADTMIEPDETFIVVLSAPVNATIAKETATATITNDDTAAPVTPGNYQGATQDGNYVFLTVLGNRTVTGFRVNDLPATCDGPLRLIGGIDWSKSVFPIWNDGRIVGEGSWTGSDVQGDAEWTSWSTKLTGFFNTPTSATGTLLVNSELNYKGRHYRCSSGEIRWSATIRG